MRSFPFRCLPSALWRLLQGLRRERVSAATSLVPRVGTGGPQTGGFTPSGSGDVTDEEFAGEPEGEEGDEGPEPFDGQLPGGVSLSKGNGSGVSVPSSAKAKSNPEFETEFEGLNLFQQRYARGGNQFTVEPPDQGLCVGNGYVVEAVNDVINVFNTSGQSVLPDNTSTNIVAGFPTDVNHAVDLNSFFGYGPAINRATGIRAQFVTDPSCLYDAATQRFFVVVLTLETVPTTGAFTQQNHIDIAVSQTSNPTGSWNIYKLDVTNDGTNTGGVNPGPYLGDYPHIGADANGFYVTTNAYPWCCNGFAGAQIYALSKAQLAAGAANIDDAAHRHVGHGQRPERRRRDPARLHRLAGAVARHRLLRVVERRNRVLPQLQRRRRGDPPQGRHGRRSHLNANRGLDDDQHVVVEHRNPKREPQQPGSVREPIRTAPEAAAAGVGHAARASGSAGVLHQQHHNGDHRGCGLLASALRRRAGAQRSDLHAGLERHSHAAGDVRQRQAMGRT